MNIKTLTAELTAIYSWADALADMGQIEAGLAYLDRKASAIANIKWAIADEQYMSRPSSASSSRRSYGYTDYPRG